MSTAEESEAAAQLAAEELATLKTAHPEAFEIVAGWWKKHYLATGHRRLGRLLVGREGSKRREAGSD